MDATQWNDIVAPFYISAGKAVEELTRQGNLDFDLLRLKREELADRFEDAKAGLAEAADLAKKNAVADLASRGLAGSTIKDSRQKGIDDRAGQELEKLHREYNRTLERLAVLERNSTPPKVITVDANQKPIFISHAKADKDFVDRFVDLLVTGVGVTRGDMFCTSLEDMGVPTGENFVEFIKSQIQSPQLVLMIITENYLASKFCLCEMGACWAMSHKGIPLLVEPIGYENLDGVLTATQAIKISDAPKLSELKDEICKLLNLEINSATWERKRNDFIEAIPIVPQTKEIVVSASEPIVETRSATLTIPERISRLINHLETNMEKMPAINCSADINRLFAQAATRLKTIYAESVERSIDTGQLPEVIKTAEAAAFTRQLEMLDSLKHRANLAIKMLREHLQFLLLDE